MILYPAIDLKDGQCVRLVKGDMAAATVFSDDPGAQARAFADAGFAWIHVVDLNGAFAGRPVNAEAVDSILSAVTIPVQLGGGIRDMATIADWLARGVARVILGTAALRDPQLVRAACREFPGQVAVGIDARCGDARGGRVAVEGWAETSDTNALDLARAYEDAGVTAIIYTDIERDGALSGPNVEATAALARQISTPVIASGGVSGHGDLAALKAVEETGIEGVICGRALYDGRIEAAAALALLAA
jgi:phosphoribosylformimino-5-aminoimidazole carboxamide ribotide isomerase